MLTCYIIDDEPSAINVLTDYVKKTPFLDLIGSANNPLDALQEIREKNIDLVFLDIQMPNITGLDFKKMLPVSTNVMFTTAYSEYAVEGFKLEALDYLVKPISFERFLNAAQRGLNNSTSTSAQWKPAESNDDYFFVKTEMKGKVIKINFKEIIYIEGLKNYVTIYTETGKVIAYLSFKQLEAKLPASSFMRVHKSYIIASTRIRAVDGNQILLNDTTAAIPLGETYRKSFFGSLQDKLMGGKR